MLINLREFQRKPTKLSDFLLWAAMIEQGVVLNKNGSLQITFRYRGPDLASATKQELVVISVRINNILKRLSSGWVLYAEAQRFRSQQYDKGIGFPDPISKAIDAERCQYFSEGYHYESNYYLTLVYLPPEDNRDKMKKMFIEGNNNKLPSGEEHLKTFLDEKEKIIQLFKEVLPEAEALTSDETLTYLHSCISPKHHYIKTPDTPMYLDAFLVDSPLLGGLKPMLGDHHVRVISILHYPGDTLPGLFDNLNQLNFEYRWVSRFIALDKNEAITETQKYQRLWSGKRKSMLGLIKEMITQTESNQINEDAVIKADDAAAAGLELSSDCVAYGYYMMVVVVMDKDENIVDKKARAVEKTINNLGFTAVVETLNAVDAWFASVPGQCLSHVRRPLFNTLNLMHVLPISAVWAGPERNKHLKGPTLLRTETNGNTPFRLDLHVDDVGHTMVLGPTGAGKSVLLDLMAAQFRKYPKAKVYFFDKGGSSRVLTAGVRGQYYDIAKEKEGALSFQPLANIDDDNERSWAAEWIHDFLRASGFTLRPEHKHAIWTALCSLANSPRSHRTLTGLKVLLQDEEIKAALLPLTIEGSFGKLFDSSVDTLDTGNWQVFEIETLMNTPAAVSPALSYIFHRLEQQLDGSPVSITLDECWIMLDNEAFTAKIREWLKVFRKANASVIFATQNLTDIMESKIASAIKDSCKTKIFLPNAGANSKEMREMYENFGLNSKEIELISLATPKRQYYYKSERGSRLFELSLGPFSLAYCAASSKEDQKMCQQLLAEFGPDEFNEHWLRYKNLDQMADQFKCLYSGTK